jgi:hypothetical protein
MQIIKCLFGAHKRDRTTAWFDGYTFQARCQGCGTAMHQDRWGNWVRGVAEPREPGESQAAEQTE